MVKLVDLSKNIKSSRQCSRCKGTFIRELLTVTSLNEMLCSKCFDKRKKGKNHDLSIDTNIITIDTDPCSIG